MVMRSFVFNYMFLLCSLMLSSFNVRYLFGNKYGDINFGWFMQCMPPYMWCNIGIGLAISLSCCGAAAGTYIVGVSMLGIGVKSTRIRTKNLIAVLFCESLAIYGVLLGIMLAENLEEFMAKKNPSMAMLQLPRREYFIGFYTLGIGIAVGFANMFSGIAVGIVGSGAVLADASNSTIYVKILVIEMFASAIGLYGFVFGMLSMRYVLISY